MRSFISNSKALQSASSILRCWLLSLFLVAMLLGAVEAFWRSKGHVPTVMVDRVKLWCQERENLEKQMSHDDSAVLLGNSRILYGFCTAYFEDRFPNYNLFNLAIEAEHPVATLRDIADNSDFSGVVLCQIDEPAFEKRNHGMTEDYIQRYRDDWKGEVTLEQKINLWFQAVLQSRFVIANPNLKVRTWLKDFIIRDKLPQPLHYSFKLDRSVKADFKKIANLEKHNQRFRSKSANIGLPPEKWLQEANEVEKLVDKIQSRGGRVIFLRFPVSGKHHEYFEKNWPKAKFWERFAATSSAGMIHFQDLPLDGKIICPDLAHLDYREAPEFTRILCDELVRRGEMLEAE